MGVGLVALRWAVIRLGTEVTRPRRLGNGVMFKFVRCRARGPQPLTPNSSPPICGFYPFETYASESVELGFDRPALSMATA